MAKKSLTQQFRDLEALAERIMDEKLRTMPSHGCPKVIYENKFRPDIEQKPEERCITLTVTKKIAQPLTTFREFRPKINARASQQDIEKMQKFIDYLNSPSWEIRYLYEEKASRYNRGGSLRDDEIDNRKYALSPEGFEQYNKEKKEEYDRYYAPRPGYTPCARCHRQVPDNKVIWSTIYGGSCRGMMTKMAFCSGECAGQEQMANEG